MGVAISTPISRDEAPSEITRLPEDCISHAMSLSSPRDCCRSAVVSTMFRSAAESDTVWERFLPPDWADILSRANEPVKFSSKKDLYFRLCNPFLVDGKRMSFSLEKSTGRKCYTLCARELGIVSRDSHDYWRWINVPDSRFPLVAELMNVYWLELKGRLDSNLLSRRTNYAAYLIYKIPYGSRGFGNQTASILFGSQSSSTAVCLKPERRKPGGSRSRHPQHNEGEETREVARAPHPRLDGWMEMEMGEFFSGDGDNGNVVMHLLENGPPKNGLIIEGIEVRPK